MAYYTSTGYQDMPKRQELDLLRSQLENERTSFESHWRDIADFIAPRRLRLTLSDVNRGDKRNQKIIDSTATAASRTLSAGMMSNITSPARPWFKLTTPDAQLNSVPAVKSWLDDSTDRMTTVFLKSNLYNKLPTCYEDLGNFATGCIFVEEDFDEVLRTYALPVGSYWFSVDEKGKPNVFIREFRMTVRQLVKKFGKRSAEGSIDWSNFSSIVKSYWENKNYEFWVDVRHVISPNSDFDEKKLESKYKRFQSCYYEIGACGQNGSGYGAYTSEDREKFLQEKGYDRFPVLIPRWKVTGEDSWGTDCPGMMALGDVKQLQHGERRSMQAIDKLVHPQMQAPSSVATQKSPSLPGELSYVPSSQAGQGLRPVYEINPRIQELEGKQEQVRVRIKKAYFEDLFLILSELRRDDITATQVRGIEQERLLVLGPVLEQLNQDLLDPLIDITFDYMLRQGKLAPPPPELQGVDLKIEYISIMAQAQKLLGISSIERFTGFVTNLATALPEVLDKLDADEIVDIYADISSVPQGAVRSDDKVAEIRNQRARAQAAAQKAQTMEQASTVAKNLSSANLETDNALTRGINDGSLAAAVAGG